MKRLNFVILVVAVVVLSCVGSRALATVAVGTGWQSEYDGTEAGTLAMWNFNESEQYMMYGTKDTQGVLPNQSGTGDKDWDARYNPEAATTMSFDATGKFGEGMSQTGYQGGNGDEKVISYHSKDTTSLFPSASDSSLSVEMWVKFDSVTTTQYLIDKGIGWGETSGFGMRWIGDSSTTKLEWSVGDGSERMQIRDYNFEPVTGQWYHIAGVWDADADTSSIYINGELTKEGEFTGKSIVDYSGKTLALGNRTQSSYKSVNGTIDQVRIGDVAYSYTPEPATMAILGLGSLMMIRRRK